MIGSPYNTNVRWWPDIDGEEVDGYSAEDDNGAKTRHERLIPAAWLVWTRNGARRQQNLYYGKLYGGLEGVTADPMGVDPAAQTFEPASLPYNIVRSGTNSLVAKVAKDRPIPTYLPVGGDHRVHKRVKLLNKFVAGLFHKHKVHAKGYAATRDAALQGQGQVLIMPNRNRIELDGLLPWEVNVDPVDARYGDPRSLYLIRYLDKDMLRRRYPGHDEAIRSAAVLNESFFPIQDAFSVTNRCTVVEAFHLRSDPESHDGVHSVCLLNETLLDEEWEHDEFPIALVRKDIPLAGWWGTGLGDEMCGFQDETNVMAERVQYAHRIVGGQVWMVPDGGGVLDTDFNDDIGVVVRYQGGPAMVPQCTNPQPLHPQTYEYFKDLPPTAFSFSGISTTSAQSTQPKGVTAALALQTLDDMETDRFSMFERAHEEFYVDVGRHMLRCVRHIAKEYGDFEVFTANKGSGQKVLWTRDVDLDEDSFIVQAWPESILPKTPSAKLQRIIELSAQQIYDRPQVLKLLGNPDTEAEERLLLAPREAAEAQIAHILECEDPRDPYGYIPPGDFQDLSYAMARSSQEYNLLQADAIDSGTYSDPTVCARLSNLAAYSKACSDKLEEAKNRAMLQAQLAQTAPGMNAGAAPTGVPMAPQPVAGPGPMGNLGTT